MSDREKEVRGQVKNQTTAKLHELAEKFGERTVEGQVVMQVIREREWWRNFWTSGIVAWIALGLSAGALIWQYASG